MTKKEQILETIETLKKEKPEHWKRDVRVWLKELALLDDPYREHEYQGSEGAGRHGHLPSGCPRFDRMDDRSWP